MTHESHFTLVKNKINLIMVGLMVGLLVAAFDYSIMGTAMPKVIQQSPGNGILHMALYVLHVDVNYCRNSLW